MALRVSRDARVCGECEGSDDLDRPLDVRIGEDGTESTRECGADGRQWLMSHHLVLASPFDREMLRRRRRWER